MRIQPGGLLYGAERDLSGTAEYLVQFVTQKELRRVHVTET